MRVSVVWRILLVLALAAGLGLGGCKTGSEPVSQGPLLAPDGQDAQDALQVATVAFHNRNFATSADLFQAIVEVADQDGTRLAAEHGLACSLLAEAESAGDRERALAMYSRVVRDMGGKGLHPDPSMAVVVFAAMSGQLEEVSDSPAASTSSDDASTLADMSVTEFEEFCGRCPQQMEVEQLRHVLDIMSREIESLEQRLSEKNILY